MTRPNILGSLIAPSAALSSATLGALAAFLGAGISGVSLAHLSAGHLAAAEGIQWGTLLGGATAFLVGTVILALCRRSGAGRPLLVRIAVWNAAGVVLAPAMIAAGAWVGATGGTGTQGHAGDVLQALPAVWPVAACLALLALATGLLASTAADDEIEG